MSRFDEQLKRIQELRSQRDSQSESLYASQLGLHKIESLLQQSTGNEVIPADQAATDEIRSQIAQLEAHQHELNGQLNESDRVLEKIRENEGQIQFLKDKIAVIESQLQEAQNNLSEPSDTGTEKLSERLAELNRWLEKADAARQSLAQNRGQIIAGREKVTAEKNKLRDAIASLEKRLSASAGTRPQRGSELEDTRSQLQAAYERHKQNVAVHDADLRSAIEDIYVDPHPRSTISELNDGLPFLLTPVRIETRFISVGRGSELWVRIYPDDIAVHTHEELLTDQEVTAGETYWKALFKAGKNGGEQKEDQKKTAWANLASVFGPQRSTWIAKQTMPLNWTSDLSGIGDESQLQFPPHDLTKTHAWSRAPRTRVLPDKFVVMLYQDETLVHEEIGRVIPDELTVGPDPMEADEAFKEENGRLMFGGAFDWASDFNKAVELGMGFKIPLTAAQASAGFDRILVLGVSLSIDSAESQKRLEELIDNHHYSPKGFSLLPQGTPTNNTEQDGSGYTQSDLPINTSYFLETGDPAFDANTDCDGRNLADALGIEYGPLQNILNSDGVDHKQAVLMNKALYPATLGYFFETLLQPVFNGTSLDSIREFFVHNVTGRGPLPVLRVGDQPYGVLLTSDFSRWKVSRRESPSQIPFLNGLQAVLSNYQQLWEGLLDDLMYVGKPGQDPDAVLMNILGLQAGSVSFHQRTGYSTDYLKNLDDFQYGGRYAADMQNNFTQKNVLLNFLNGFGYNVRDQAGFLKVPQALRLIYQHYSTLLDAANLVDNVPLSEKNAVRYYDEMNKKNYLHWLAETSTIAALERQDFGSGKTAPNTLLYLELRRALLLQLHKASVGWFKKHDIALEQTLQPVNFHNIRPQGDLTKYEVMRAMVGTALPGNPNAALSVSDYLLTAGNNEDEARFLIEMRDALTDLADVSTAKLERCLTEHLDTCTYRLDAWQTALFRLRLLQQRNIAGDEDDRSKRRKGIFLGSYGWLENVRPSARQQVALDTVPEKLRPADNEPLFEYGDNEGFVHAPSINHASAAAILRSGYVSHADEDHPDMMAVNLSSERVRRALFILSGMRSGQTLEALLGYQFERGLHDRASADDALKKLNLYIYDFRDKFPYEQHHIKQQGSTDAATESIPVVNVVNGVTLAEVTTAFPYGASGSVASATTAERVAIEQEKDKLADTLDAVKDLLLAESTYQMVQGNIDRSGAVLNALKDVSIPPELDVINTPRSSQLTFTNRVTLHFENADPGLPANNPWNSIPMTPRAQMEAGLNKWLGSVLGDPADLLFRAAHLDADEIEIDHLDMSIADLAIQPIDLMYITGNELNSGVADGSEEARTGASELEARIAHHYRQVKALEDEVIVRIEFMKPEINGGRTLGQLLPLLRMLKSMITDSRPLHAGDFEPASKTGTADPANPQGYDVSNLQGRVEAISVLFRSQLDELGNIPISAIVKDVHGDLQSYIDLKGTFAAMDVSKVDFDEITYDFDGIYVSGLQNVLTRISNVGLADAFPRLTSAFTEEAKRILLQQAASVLRRGEAADARASTLLTEAAAVAEVRIKVEKYIAAGKTLLGDVFNILPVFTYRNAADIQQSHADQPQLLKYAKETLKMIFPADEWLQSVSHVRPRTARWDGVRALVESFNAASLELNPLQLPYRARDSWLAVEFPETDELTHEPFNILHDTLSVITHGEEALTSSGQCGLLIDDWTEMIPTKEEVTGLTFNYDRPNASPPQALLLAVTPEETGQWDWDDLVGILHDTLQRAKRRAVEPLMLDKVNRPELGVLLPAVVADFSQYDLNISLDYRLNLKSLLESIPILSVDGS
jgi:hypothetical protein